MRLDSDAARTGLMTWRVLSNCHTLSCRSSSPETSALAEDLIDALCGLLLLPFTPATALWHIGWLLRQLLPGKPGSPGRLSAPQRGLLESALRLSRQFLMAELNGACPHLLYMTRMLTRVYACFGTCTHRPFRVLRVMLGTVIG